MTQARNASRLGRVPLVLTAATLEPLQDRGRRHQCSLRQLLFISLAHALGQQATACARGEGLTLTDISSGAGRTTSARRRLGAVRTGSGAFLYERRRRARAGVPATSATDGLAASTPPTKGYDLVARATEYDDVLLLEFFFEPDVVPAHRAGGWLVAFAQDLERLARTLA
ncbi:hypothetical protein [Bordetella sp. N]|uniref:hypothetical protein n=1 Tax=Bordetella sp. N TaxID=1746199 RepID=UPI00070D86D6|nr:hypothetical protein [Bordetella sp. N]ALM82680.1 hypothetical protein ASB57_06675 [Bordetella sp. N]